MILVNKADDPLDQAANQTLFEYRSAMKFAYSKKKVFPWRHALTHYCRCSPFRGGRDAALPRPGATSTSYTIAKR